MSPAAFLIEDGLAASLPAGLRPWTLAPGAGAVFSTTLEGEAEPVWRVIPGSGHASRDLAGAERALEEVDGALRTAEHRLQVLAVRGFPPGEAPHDPSESLLRSALSGLPGVTVDAVTYSLADRISPAWERAHAAFRSALGHLERLVNGRSWVETSRNNRLLARTMLGRAGDRSTAWQSGISGTDRNLHVHAVDLAQRSAVTFARTIALAVRGAALVARLVSGPAGMLFALPAVWAFIDDVIAMADGSGS